MRWFSLTDYISPPHAGQYFILRLSYHHGMAAVSSKLRSPLWTPSTELSETQQRNWPEAHYLSNAAPLTDRHRRARADTPYSLWLTGHQRAKAVLSRTFRAHLEIPECLNLKKKVFSQIDCILVSSNQTDPDSIQDFQVHIWMWGCMWTIFSCRYRQRWTQIINAVTGWFPKVCLLRSLWVHHWESQRFSAIPPGFHEACLHDAHPRSRPRLWQNTPTM